MWRSYEYYYCEIWHLYEREYFELYDLDEAYGFFYFILPGAKEDSYKINYHQRNEWFRIFLNSSVDPMIIFYHSQR